MHFVERQFEIKREREWWRWREREENQPMKRTEKIYRQTHFATNEGEDRESFTYSFFSSSNKYHGWETLFYMLIVLLITLTKTSLCMAARTIWKDNQFSFFFAIFARTYSYELADWTKNKQIDQMSLTFTYFKFSSVSVNFKCTKIKDISFHLEILNENLAIFWHSNHWSPFDWIKIPTTEKKNPSVALNCIKIEVLSLESWPQFAHMISVMQTLCYCLEKCRIHLITMW